MIVRASVEFLFLFSSSLFFLVLCMRVPNIVGSVFENGVLK